MATAVFPGADHPVSVRSRRARPFPSLSEGRAASSAGDLTTLKSAARQNPLVYWAMRYAAAVASIDGGEPREAVRLLEGAPHWPRDSAFAAFHEEIAAHAVAG